MTLRWQGGGLRGSAEPRASRRMPHFPRRSARPRAGRGRLAAEADPYRL